MHRCKIKEKFGIKELLWSAILGVIVFINNGFLKKGFRPSQQKSGCPDPTKNPVVHTTGFFKFYLTGLNSRN